MTDRNKAKHDTLCHVLQDHKPLDPFCKCGVCTGKVPITNELVAAVIALNRAERSLTPEQKRAKTTKLKRRLRYFGGE